MENKLDEKPDSVEVDKKTTELSTPIWHSPKWIAAIVTLVSVFLTVPEIIANYLTKQQDIKLAEEKTEAMRLGNLESKQEQEFKIVNNTLAQQGTERIFVLRYLAATLDDSDAKAWAASEVVRLDDLASRQEALEIASVEVAAKERDLKEGIERGDENVVALKAELEELRNQLELKKSGVSELRQKAGFHKSELVLGMGTDAQDLMLIRIKRNLNHDSSAKSVFVETSGLHSPCVFEGEYCEQLIRRHEPPDYITITSSRGSDHNLFGSMSVSFYKSIRDMGPKKSLFTRLILQQQIGHFFRNTIDYSCINEGEEISCIRAESHEQPKASSNNPVN